jgi:hypothetical protein
MSDRPAYAPKVKLTALWQRRSAKGKTYFSGFLGAARIIVLKDEQAEVPDGVDGIWTVFVQEKLEQERSGEPQQRRRRFDRTEPVGVGGQRFSTKPVRHDQADHRADLDDRLDDLPALGGDQ